MTFSMIQLGQNHIFIWSVIFSNVFDGTEVKVTKLQTQVQILPDHWKIDYL